MLLWWYFRYFVFRPLFWLLLLSFSVLSRQDETVEEMKFQLNSGDFMPLIGFGTYQIRGRQLIKDTLDFALGAGYRLIDTAAVYGNEQDIGIALKEILPKYNLTRKDVFITSKLAPQDQGEKAYKALEESLKKLDCDYIDLYLIHWPGVNGLNVSDSRNRVLRNESWLQLVKGKKNGLTRNIGVSNYNVRHLMELLTNDHGVKPAVNQVEWHPHYHSDDLLDFCRKEGILLQAYSSLGGTNNTDLLTDPEVHKIAEKFGKSPAQILLCWALQQNIAIIPKARSKKHIEDNINLNFNISESDMNILNNFKQTKYAWNPNTVV